MWEYGIIRSFSQPRVYWGFRTPESQIDNDDLISLLNKVGIEGWEVILQDDSGKLLLKRRISK